MSFLLPLLLFACRSEPSRPDRQPAPEPATTGPSTSEPDGTAAAGQDPAAEVSTWCGGLDVFLHFDDWGTDRPLDIATTPDGGIVVVGEFYGALTLGKGEPNETVLSGPGLEGVIAKLSASGTLEWVVQISGAVHDRVESVAVGQDGRVVVAGEYRSDATVISSASQESGVIAWGGGDLSDVFVLALSAEGRELWHSTVAGAAAIINAGGVAVGDAGAVYLTGDFEYGQVEVAPGTGASVTFPIGGDLQDSFVARFEPDGTLAWARHLTGEYEETAVGLGLVDDTVVAVGTFRSDLVVAAGQPDEVRIEPPFAHLGATLVYLAAFTENGDVAWTRTAGSLDAVDSVSDAMATDAEVVIVGRGGSYAVFGEGEPGEASLGEAHGPYAAGFGGDGNLHWLRPQSTGAVDLMDSVAVDAATGRVAIGGELGGTYTFPVGLGGATFTGPAVNAPYLATYGPDGAFECAWVFENASFGSPLPQGSAIAFDGEGGLWVGGWFYDGLTYGEGTPDEVVIDGTAEGDMFLARVIPVVTEPPEPAP